MTRILVLVDGSPGALHAVAHIVERAKAGEPVQLVLLNVQPPVLAPNLTNLLDARMIDEYYVAEGEAALRAARQQVADAGLEAATETRVGPVGITIAAFLRESGCDEVAMGTRGRGSLGRLMLGSVADKVLHLVDVPVTIVGGSSGTLVPRVLVPVDGSEPSLRAVRHAVAIARLLPATEIVVANVQPRIRANARVARIVSQAMIDDYSRQKSEEAAALARKLLDAEGRNYVADLRLGPVVPLLLRIARERRCDRIVMGTRGAGGLSNLVLGSVARQVATHAPVPVTLVK